MKTVRNKNSKTLTKLDKHTHIICVYVFRLNEVHYVFFFLFYYCRIFPGE